MTQLDYLLKIRNILAESNDVTTLTYLDKQIDKMLVKEIKKTLEKKIKKTLDR